MIKMTSKDFWTRLIDKFKPLVILHPDEDYFPASIDFILENSRLYSSNGHCIAPKGQLNKYNLDSYSQKYGSDVSINIDPTIWDGEENNVNNVPFYVAYYETDKNREEIYLWESDLGQKKKAGPRLIPLKEKLKLYKGSKIGAWRPLKKTSNGKNSSLPSPSEYLSIINKYMDYDMDHRVLTWWFAGWWNWAYDAFKTEDKVFCSELVAMTLQELGILKSDRPAAWFCPGDWYEHEHKLKQALTSDYAYGSTRFFDFSMIK